MGKGTNFSGQPVLSQLIKLMDRSKINILASKSGANYYTKHLDGYSHLVVMLYAVLSNLRSLRETCLGFAANATRMNHLGIDLVTLLNCPKLDWNLLEQQRARWVASQDIQQLELFPT